MRVQCFDNVFSPSACSALHAAASTRGLGHALYTRDSGPITPLEHAFEHFLSEIKDDSRHVEYWSRQEWKHIEAHADVDEKLAAGGGPFRFPRHGHVLYLQVGPRVQGPTCVWEPDFGGALTTVPAVAGRILRFEGSLQHAVPKPADVWLSPFVITQSGTADEFMRSVVLFNCWPDEPPLEVTSEDTTSPPDGSDLFYSTPRAAWRVLEPQAPQSLSTRSRLGMQTVALLCGRPALRTLSVVGALAVDQQTASGSGT